MKNRSSLTLYNDPNQASPNKFSVTKIAVLNPEEIKKFQETLAFFNTQAPEEDYANLFERSKRHFNATMIANALYHTGATIINGADQIDSNNNQALVPVDSIQTSDQRSNAYLDTYNSLPSYTSIQGSTVTQNTFHVLYIMKVALDNLSPQKVFHLYAQLKMEGSHMTIRPGENLSFPNGSELLSDHAMHAILSYYIKSNPQKFAEIEKNYQWPDKSIPQLIRRFEELDFRFIFGNVNPQKEVAINKVYTAILNGKNIPLLEYKAATSAIPPLAVDNGQPKNKDEKPGCRVM